MLAPKRNREEKDKNLKLNNGAKDKSIFQKYSDRFSKWLSKASLENLTGKNKKGHTELTVIKNPSTNNPNHASNIDNITVTDDNLVQVSPRHNEANSKNPNNRHHHIVKAQPVTSAECRSHLEIRDSSEHEIGDKCNHESRKYAIGQYLSQGFFGAVFKAKRCIDDVTVAIKISLSGPENYQSTTIGEVQQRVKKVRVESMDAIQRAEKEREFKGVYFKEVATLRIAQPHPFIIALYDQFHINTDLCIVLEFAINGDFKSYLARINRPLIENEARFYFAQLTLALEHIHNLGVAHMDLKEQNILVDTEGYLKLADFGFAGTQQNIAPKGVEEKLNNTRKELRSSEAMLRNYIALVAYTTILSLHFNNTKYSRQMMTLNMGEN